MKKALFALLSFTTAVIVFLAAFAAVLNLYLVPRILLPAVRSGIAEFNKNGKISVKIEHVYFHVFKGFQLEDIHISEAGPAGRDIIKAESADIDLNYLPLLQKTVEISNIDIPNADLYILRDVKGPWNFEKALEMKPLDGKPAGPMKMFIKSVKVTDARVHYRDHFQRNNSINRTYQSVEASASSADGKKYLFELKGSDETKKESAQIKCFFDPDKGELDAQARLKTPSIGEYWNYYLDEILHPWSFSAGMLEADLKLSSSRKKLDINGSYRVRHGMLGFGDLKFSGNADITHRQEIDILKRKNLSLKGSLRAQGVTSYAGKNKFLTNGTLLASAAGQRVNIQKITGNLKNGPLDIKGTLGLAFPRRLELAGRVTDSDDRLVLTMPTDNSGAGEFLSSNESGSVRLKASSDNLKDLSFTADIDADINLSKLSDKLKLRFEARNKKLNIEISGADLKGRLKVNGTLKGEADEIDKLSGRLGLKLEDFSVLDLPPVSFKLGMRANNGLFEAGIPGTAYYGGTVSGGVAMDMKRWGVEIDVKGCDIAELGRVSPDFKGLKGRFTGNAAAVAGWDDFGSMKGGGYFNISNCDLSKAPFFAAVTQGMKDVSGGFVMPEFGKIEGNFDIRGGAVTFDRATCQDKALTLNVSGKYFFSGDIDFTVGLRVFKSGFWNTMRQILFPVTIGFDILSEGVKINLTGKWPALKQSASVQPMNWFSRVFGPDVAYDPNRYNLKDLWQSEI